MIEADDAQLTLLQHNAWLAFPQLTLTHLHKLVSHLEIPYGSRKPTLTDTIMLLVRHILPHVSDEELDAIAKNKGSKCLQRGISFSLH